MPPGEGGRGATPQPKPRPRDRLISYVANDHTQAANKQDPTDDEIPLNKRIGDDAVGWVLQYERHQGRNPDPSNHIQNLAGFDVVSHKPGQKDPRFIEVKGTKGGWGNAGIPLSVRQFDFAKEKGHLFWLYVVEFADLPEEVTIYPIQNPVNRINQFRFDCGWKHLAQPDTQFRPVLPKPGLRIQLTKTQHPPRTGRIKSVKNYDGRYELQVAWADGPHGMVWFEPLTVQILPDTTLEASSL